MGVEDPTAVRAARRMIDRGIAVDSVRLADPAVDLRKLLRGWCAAPRHTRLGFTRRRNGMTP